MTDSPMRPVIDFQRRYVRELQFARMLPGSWDKRFAKEMGERFAQDEPGPLSPNQWAHVCRLFWKYRRQLAAGMMHSEPGKGGLPLPVVDSDKYRREMKATDVLQSQLSNRAGWKETLRE